MDFCVFSCCFLSSASDVCLIYLFLELFALAKQIENSFVEIRVALLDELRTRHLSDKSQLLVLQIMFCLICSKANLARRKQLHQTCISQLPSGKLSVILASQMSAFCNTLFETSDQGSPKKCPISVNQITLSLLSAH